MVKIQSLPFFHRLIQRITLSGSTLSPNTSYHYNREPIHYRAAFKDITSIQLADSTTMLNRICYRPDGHTEVIAYLGTGRGHAFGVMMKNEDVDRLIAAFMVLAPQAKLSKR